ncbi:hypothetical protein D6D01_06276 [Aureobasidium pullulans]|uniref:Cryptic loci regulator 2 N-terminal domain-containing protein n=1 Tax=Aureobasidium pullulans TaxID=5580 RepID=A0A4S9L0Q6_AURPU|nr:hypothetical protein D6D01_06276 [Aureobasidium pullulans]
MAAQIDLSAPIYQGDGTGNVILGANERIEPDTEALNAITHAFRRMLDGPQGVGLRVEICKSSYHEHYPVPLDVQANLLSSQFTSANLWVVSLRGFTHVRYDPTDRRDLRIHGHPSGRVYISGPDFVPHIVWLMRLRLDDCQCRFC